MPLERPTPQEQVNPASDSSLQETVSQLYSSSTSEGFKNLNSKGSEADKTNLKSILPGLDIQDKASENTEMLDGENQDKGKRRGPEKPYKPYTGKPEFNDGRTGGRLYTELPTKPKPTDKPGVKPIDKPGVKPEPTDNDSEEVKPGTKPDCYKPIYKPADVKPRGDKPAPSDKPLQSPLKPLDGAIKFPEKGPIKTGRVFDDSSLYRGPKKN